MNDAIRLAVENAVEIYGAKSGPNAGTFTAACLSKSLMKLAGLDGCIDGKLIRVILTGRSDVTSVSDGYYKFNCNYP